MSDDESKKPPPPAPPLASLPLAQPVVRAFPPVARPAGAAAPELSSEPKAVPYAVEVHEAPPGAGAADDEDPPSLEALVKPRATQVSEPLALEALGRAARLIVNPISTAEASGPAVLDFDSAPSHARSVGEVPLSSEGPSVLFDAVPVTDPFARAPAITSEDAPHSPAPLTTVDSVSIADLPTPPDGILPELSELLEEPMEEAPITRPSIPHAESVAAAVVTPAPPITMASKHAPPAPESTVVTTRLVASLLITASLVMVIWHMQLTSRENANTGSRYATIESLVDYGTYNIDASRYLFTPDKVKARDHFVSSKPPLLPTYGAGIYWLLKKVTGYNITDNESIVVWTVGVFTGWLSHLVFLIYFYKLCKLLLVRQLAVLVAVAAAGFAYLGVAYGTAINNHNMGAAFAVAGFYHAFKAKHDLGGKPDWVLSGLILGVLPAIDLSSLALTGLTAVYLGAKNWRYTLLLFIPATLPGIISQPLLAHVATGSYIPAYAESSMMTYKGSYFGGRRSGIDALFEPKPTYAFNVLLGHHGVFSMTPIFCFSLFEIGRRLWKRDRFVQETLVFAISFTVVTAFYIFRTHNYGGWCVGMRWLVPVMPWLLVMFALWLDRATIGKLKWGLVVAAFAVSAFNVQDGLTSPFQFSVWHNWLDDAPNRNRIGPTWVLSRPNPLDKKKPPHGRPKPRSK
ncbi:MAG TPA: hypothetical protein VH062_35515 [Polyangiaceae bacterium]|jgi:hypothetical protein|nr:hypothetical protein [Polyangiaceae bacterium]